MKELNIWGFKIHRKEQYDLKCWPIVCIHRKTIDECKRVFCLYFWGIQIGGFMLNRRAIHFTPHKVFRF